MPPKSSGKRHEASLLDVVDSLLEKGVVLQGDVILGVAKVDLIYLKLSTLLSALDRAVRSMEPPTPAKSPSMRVRPRPPRRPRRARP